MFVDRTVTLERAAELVGKPLASFIDIFEAKKSLGWSIPKNTLKKMNRQSKVI
jgi:hypothetical protein